MLNIAVQISWRFLKRNCDQLLLIRNSRLLCRLAEVLWRLATLTVLKVLVALCLP